MRAESQRLQHVARDGEREIRELEQNHWISSATELAELKRQSDRPAVKYPGKNVESKKTDSSETQTLAHDPEATTAEL